MKDIGVQSLPLHKPIILEKSHTLKEAALAMKRNSVGSVLVSDGEGSLKGIFTDRDLALSLALGNQAPTALLEDATQGRLVYVTDNATLKDVVNTMIKHAIRRVPVVHLRANGKQRCLGVISLDDLVKEKLIDLSEEAKILKSQLPSPREKLGKGRIKSIFHSQGRKEQSYYTFLKTVESQTTLKKGQAQNLVDQVLPLILRRLPEKAGQNFLSQLPHEIQMQMSSYISPSDRSVTGKLVLSQMKKAFHVDEDEAQFLLSGFWRSLENSISSGEMRNLGRELPKDFMNLFTETIPH